ncbi:DMT family transporter [Rhizobium tumorigenes]|uniref:DMT family transporter n=1 Tax=Rhizobium tumorigenes TaxID=2041385 RepID=A0AAF1KJ65_9HYPH|nr:DMT family transporter [Rhizobium tumorigenes]WFR98145.1 DMT family transporter [Rhizobium tumorigenes]WFR98792.1 DMT family transporter [Rhizobium tumorigenes]
MKPAATAGNLGNAVMLGVVLMLFGDLLFAVNDAVGKWLLASFALGQVLVMRSLGSFIVLIPMIARQGPSALLDVRQPGLLLGRAVMATADVSLFYAAVAYLPLADVITFYMAAPIYVAALSHFLLGERIGWRRWLAVGVGFAGVVIALRPSTAMLSLPSLFAVAGSVGFALTIISSRYLRSTRDTVLVTSQTLVVMVVGIILSVSDWREAGLDIWIAMLFLGIVGTCAHLLLTRALKLAPASLLAPLQYTLLLWAVVFGFVFFGDVPDAQLLAGAAIIVFAGLFIFHRKNLKGEDIRQAIPLDGR